MQTFLTKLQHNSAFEKLDTELTELFLENTVRFLRKVHNFFQNWLRCVCEDVFHQEMHVLVINGLLLL